MLFQSLDLVTHSIGLILYHNDFSGLDHDLQKEHNSVIPCRDMLKKALKLDKVHVYGDISRSQLVEKFDSIIE